MMVISSKKHCDLTNNRGDCQGLKMVMWKKDRIQATNCMLTEQFGLESNDSCLLEIEPEFYNLLSRRISKLPCRKKTFVCISIDCSDAKLEQWGVKLWSIQFVTTHLSIHIFDGQGPSPATWGAFFDLPAVWQTSCGTHQVGSLRVWRWHL